MTKFRAFLALAVNALAFGCSGEQVKAVNTGHDTDTKDEPVSAASSHEEKPDVDGPVCDNPDCSQSANWPRLVVGILPSELGPAEIAEEFTLTADCGTGPLDGIRNVCPYGQPFPGVCSFGVFCGLGQEEVTISLAGPKGWKYEDSLQLSAFNRCARDITYLAVVIGEDDVPDVKSPRLVSPCTF